MNLVHKCYLVHENKHYDNLDYIYIHIYITGAGHVVAAVRVPESPRCASYYNVVARVSELHT